MGWIYSIKRWRRHFPLRSTLSVVTLVSHMLNGGSSNHGNGGCNNSDTGQLNLSFLSIVLGIVENRLVQAGLRELEHLITAGKKSEDTSTTADLKSHADGCGVVDSFPLIRFEEVEKLYLEFNSLVTEWIPRATPSDGGNGSSRKVDRDLLKQVSDLFWNRLVKVGLKDKSHIHNLYSFLNESKLDSFGLAYAVVAACQLLDYQEVQLALSENHAWVEFDDPQCDTRKLTAEVTWHGRGQDDKRGQPITAAVEEQMWLYVNGHPVVCHPRVLAAAAAVTAMNPVLTSTAHCTQLIRVKQMLLWLLYDRGVIANYPLALINLAELEELSRSMSRRPSPAQLLQQAIQVNRSVYQNLHVYPYLAAAGYMYRCGNYPLALTLWSDASHVISQYNYCREDEEIYKEFLEVAADLLPHVLRLVSGAAITDDSSGQSSSLSSARRLSSDGSSCSEDTSCDIFMAAVPQLRSVVRAHAALPRDPNALRHFLLFFDGICCWEEGSSTPVLHIVWAKRFMAALCRFEASARATLPVLSDEECAAAHEQLSPLTDIVNAEVFLQYDLVRFTDNCSTSVMNPQFLLGTAFEPLHVHDELMLPPSSYSAKLSPPTSAAAPVLPLRLRSAKMRALRHLLVAPKLNAAAIELQLSAQSQVHLKRTDIDSAYTVPRKRGRRFSMPDHS